MRIIAGKWRGRTLKSFDHPGVRPTTDRVREALFSVVTSLLAARDRSWEGLRVADLFAGTGALGLEALSRGAAFAELVDTDGGSLAVAKANVALLEADARCVRRNVEKWLSRRPDASVNAFDLIFIDPPYGKGLGARALELAARSTTVAPGALIVLERGAKETPPPVPEGVSHLRTRNYGDTTVEFYEKAP